MKLRHLEIEQVGAHRHLVLPDLANGLTVLYGPNETGKSTVLASLRGLFFGRPDMEEGRPAITPESRVAAMLECTEGPLWRLERGLASRRMKPVLMSPAGERLTGDEVVKDALPELRMVEASLYQSVFTFQLAELRGLQGESGVADKLYAVGSPGGLTPYELERRLAETAKAIHNPDARARNAELLQKNREVARLRDELEATQDTPAAYLHKQDELMRAQATLTELEKQMKDAAEQRRQAQVLFDVWPHYRQLNEWRAHSGADGRVDPPWLRLHGEVTALVAEAQTAVVQLGQMRESAQEVADLLAEAAQSKAALSAPWKTPQGDGSLPLDVASVDTPAVEQAREHASRLEQGIRAVDGLANSVSTGREIAKHRLEELLAAGGTGEETIAEWTDLRQRVALRGNRLKDDMETVDRAESLWNACERDLHDLSDAQQALAQSEHVQGQSERRKVRSVAVASVIVAAVFGGYLWQAGQAPAGAVALLLGLAVAGGWLWRSNSTAQSVAASPNHDITRLENSVATEWQVVRECVAGLQTMAGDVSATPGISGAFGARIPDDPAAVRRAIQSLRQGIRQERLSLESQMTESDARRSAWERWQEAERQLSDAEAKLRVAQAELKLAEAAWATELASFGIVAYLPPTAFVAEAARVMQLRGGQTLAAKKSAHVAETARRLSAFVNRAVSTLERVQTEVPDSASVDLPIAVTEGETAAAIGREVGMGRVDPSEDEDALSRAGRLESVFHVLQSHLEGAKTRLDQWAATARAARESYVQAVTTAGGESAYDALVPELVDLTEDDVRARRDAATERVETAQQAANEHRRAVWTIEQELAQWADRQAATDAAWRLAQASAQRLQVARSWSVYAAAGALVKEARRRYERDRQPSALNAAGQVFAQVTNGRYVDLRATATVDNKSGVDVPLLVAVDGFGQAWPVEQLSRGAREQVYLALRLALLRDYASRGVVLPVVLDDPLVNFDRARFDAVFAILREEAENGQFLYLTCHDDVAALAFDAGVPVVDLTRFAQRE